MTNLFLSRFFSQGPAIVIAFDHGMFDGPIPGLEDMHTIPDKIHPDVDGLLMSPGVLEDLGADICGDRADPMPIVRINWSTIYCFDWNYHSGDTVQVCSPAQALKRGAQCVLISLSMQTGSQQRDAQNIELFSRLCNEAHELGLPVIGEYFPVNDEALDEKAMHEEVKIGCRILYELGVDTIKTFYTHKFAEVAQGCPKPILTLGGKRLASDLAALKFAKAQIDDGAAGIVFGRNVIQAQKPLELQQALIDVLKDDVSPEEAAKKYQLT